MRIGIDVGGTFTDATLIDGAHRSNVLGQGIHHAGGSFAGRDRGDCDRDGRIRACAREQSRDIVHGSTTGTNALIERTGARTGLLTTAGFRDVLEIGRVMRPMEGIYDMSVDRPPPLVPRRRCLEAIERIGPQGEIIVPLDEASVERAAESFARQEVEAVAICFLFSFLNPDHERRAAEILARRLQGVAISQSHRISPEYREYERASTAVINAYLSPVMTDYLDRLNARIAKSVRRCEAVRHSGKRRGNDGRNRAFLRGCDGELRPGRRSSRGRMVWSAAPTRANRVGRYGRHELRHRPYRAWDVAGHDGRKLPGPAGQAPYP